MNVKGLTMERQQVVMSHTAQGWQSVIEDTGEILVEAMKPLFGIPGGSRRQCFTATMAVLREKVGAKMYDYKKVIAHFNITVAEADRNIY